MPTDIISSTLSTLAHALESTPFPTATFYVENGEFQLLDVSNLNTGELPKKLTITPEQFEEGIKGDGKIFNVAESSELLPELFGHAARLGFEKIAFLPARNNSGLNGLVMVGSYKEQSLNKDSLEPLLCINKLAVN